MKALWLEAYLHLKVFEIFRVYFDIKSLNFALYGVWPYELGIRQH